MKVLVFATTWIPNTDRLQLLGHWLTLAKQLHYDCDLLLVDSASPLLDRHAIPAKVRVERFPDNIGHLFGHKPDSRDGWGRAFCFGLDLAIWGNYDYVVHIEGDSLFRLPARPIAELMRASSIDAASIISLPGRPGFTEVETGLMFFRVGYLRDSNFTMRYDWPSRTWTPSPETVIHRMLGDHLTIMPWRGRRGVRPMYRPGEVLGLDWITWAHEPQIYQEFVESVLVKTSLKENLMDCYQYGKN